MKKEQKSSEDGRVAALPRGFPVPIIELLVACKITMLNV